MFCDRVALYVGPSGGSSTYPLRVGEVAPPTFDAKGEVRTLKMVFGSETPKAPETLEMSVVA